MIATTVQHIQLQHHEKECVPLSELKELLKKSGVDKNKIYEISSIYNVSLLEFMTFLLNHDLTFGKKIIVLKQPTDIGMTDFLFIINKDDESCIKVTMLDKRFQSLLLYIERHNI